MHWLEHFVRLVRVEIFFNLSLQRLIELALSITRSLPRIYFATYLCTVNSAPILFARKNQISLQPIIS